MIRLLLLIKVIIADGSDNEDDGFVVTDPKTGKKKDYRYGVVEDPTDLSAFGGSGDDDNNNNPGNLNTGNTVKMPRLMEVDDDNTMN